MRKLLFAALAICSTVLGLVQESRADGMFDHLGCLGSKRIAAVRQSPAAVSNVYKACRQELDAKLGAMDLSERQMQYAFASILAHAMANYGTSHAISLRGLLDSKFLKCDSYALLTGYLSEILTSENVYLRFVGLDGGAVGNHTQIIVQAPRGEILLDPTIGLVAKIGFNDLLSGRPLDGEAMKVFRQHYNAGIHLFADQVIDAIQHGKYRPSDLLYYLSSLKTYVAFTNEIAPLWQGGVDELLLRFPTPGAEALRRDIVPVAKH